jgi:hypothetical protein
MNELNVEKERMGKFVKCAFENSFAGNVFFEIIDPLSKICFELSQRMAFMDNLITMTIQKKNADTDTTYAFLWNVMTLGEISSSDITVKTNLKQVVEENAKMYDLDEGIKTPLPPIPSGTFTPFKVTTPPPKKAIVTPPPPSTSTSRVVTPSKNLEKMWEAYQVKYSPQTASPGEILKLIDDLMASETENSAKQYIKTKLSAVYWKKGTRTDRPIIQLMKDINGFSLLRKWMAEEPIYEGTVRVDKHRDGRLILDLTVDGVKRSPFTLKSRYYKFWSSEISISAEKTLSIRPIHLSADPISETISGTQISISIPQTTKAYSKVYAITVKLGARDAVCAIFIDKNMKKGAFKINCYVTFTMVRSKAEAKEILDLVGRNTIDSLLDSI